MITIFLASIQPPTYADDSANITFQDIYKWITPPLPPLNPDPDVPTYTTPQVECV